MRNYELLCAFRVKEGHDVSGIEAVKKILQKEEALMKSEEDKGDRGLAYPVKKETRARYRLFCITVDQSKIPSIGEALKLRKEILRHFFVAMGT